MALTFNYASPQLEEPAASTLSPQGMAANAIRQLMMPVGWSLPGRPEVSPPTLQDFPDNADMVSADILHHRAARWLEYIEGQRAAAEVRFRRISNRHKWAEQEARFKHGKNVDKWPEDVFNNVRDLDTQKVEAEAFKIAVDGAKDSLEKVRAAASRTISRHQASAFGHQGGNQTWNPST